jgi:cytidine deaminase
MFSSAPARLRLDGGDELTRAALQAASRAYAPYSKAPSGCAVATKSGRTFAGSYLENAAFNPSLSPLQAALINCGFAGEDFAAINRVVLVEMKNASISQSANTKAVLAAVAPHARFDLVTAG